MLLSLLDSCTFEGQEQWDRPCPVPKRARGEVVNEPPLFAHIPLKHRMVDLMVWALN